jgi:hypothetical protein
MGNSSSLYLNDPWIKTSSTTTKVWQMVNDQILDSNRLSSFSYDMLNKTELDKELPRNVLRLQLSLKYFNELGDISKIVHDKRALNSMLFMTSLAKQFKEARFDYRLFKEYNIEEITVGILYYCMNDAKLFVDEYAYLEANREELKNARQYDDLKVKFLFVYRLMHVLYKITDKSKQFRYGFHEKSGTMVTMDYLTDDKFVLNLMRFKLSKNKEAYSAANCEEPFDTGLFLLRYFIDTIRNLTKIADNTKKEWNQMNATAKLLHLAELVASNPAHRLSNYVAITNVVNDLEIETLPNTQLIIKDIVYLIKMGADLLKDIAKKPFIKRNKVELNEDKDYSEVLIVTCDDYEFNIVELLEAVYKIAMNDTIKFNIYNNQEINQSVKTIILKGNSIEKEYATKLLWQLCFDCRVCEKVNQDEELLMFFQELSKSHANGDTLLRKNIKGILWLNSQYNKIVQNQQEISAYTAAEDKVEKTRDKFKKILKIPNKSSSLFNELKVKLEKDNIIPRRKKSTSSMSSASSIQSLNNFSAHSSYTKSISKNRPSLTEESLDEVKYEKAEGQEHIMISYNRESRELCLKIKKELEDLKWKVWIDVEGFLKLLFSFFSFFIFPCFFLNMK